MNSLGIPVLDITEPNDLPAPASPQSALQAAVAAAATDPELSRARQTQLARRMAEVKPDLVQAIRNARSSNFELSLIQVHHSV
jgi:D-alanyl-D-alanine dipeptidase